MSSAGDDLIALEQMKSHLKRHGFTPKKEPNGIFHICYCPVCNKGQQISTQRLYLNAKTSGFSCSNCKSRGSLTQLISALGTVNDGCQSADAAANEEGKLQKVARLLQEFVPLQESEWPVDKQTAEKLGCRFYLAPQKGTIFIACPLFSAVSGELDSNVAGEYFCSVEKEPLEFFLPASSPDAPTLKAFGTLEHSEKAACSSLIVTDSLVEFVRLVEGGQQEADLLFVPKAFLSSTGYSPSDLHKYERVFLWSESVSAFEALVAELGYLKCFKPASSVPSANLSEGWSKVPHPSLFSMRQRSASGWNEILGELSAVKRIDIPLASLPSFSRITKGFRTGELTIFSGPTGCGKTTFLSQMSLDYCSQNVPTLWGSFEIRNTRLMAKMLRQIAPKSPDLMNAEELQILQSRFEALPMYFMDHFGSTVFEDVLDTMEYAVLVHGVKHILLDNLQFMLSGQDNGNIDKFAIADKVIGQLREFCSKRNVHITLVVHPRKEEDGAALGLNSISGTAKATQEADLVVLLQNTGLGEENAINSSRRFVEVKKNRFDGTLGSIALAFNRDMQIVSLAEFEFR